MTDPAPPSKAELRERMEAGLLRFLAAIDAMSDEEMLDRKDDAGWNVRDHVAHLAVWADGVAAHMNKQDRWAAMGVPRSNPRSDSLDFDTINERIASQHRHRSPAEARAMLIAAHQRLVAALESLPDDGLDAPYDSFVSPFTARTGRPIWGYIAGDSYDHYDEHLPWLPR